MRNKRAARGKGEGEREKDSKTSCRNKGGRTKITGCIVNMVVKNN